jgi:hypothetical protein
VHTSVQSISAKGVGGNEIYAYEALTLESHNDFGSPQNFVLRPPQTNPPYSSNTFGENVGIDPPGLSQDFFRHQTSTLLSQRPVGLSRHDSHTEPALHSGSVNSGLLPFSSGYRSSLLQERALPPQALDYISTQTHWPFSATPGIPARQGHNELTYSTMSNSRQGQIFSQRNTNGTTSNTTPLSLISKSHYMVASSSSGSSQPEEKSSVCPTEDDLRLSRASFRLGSSHTTTQCTRF